MRARLLTFHRWLGAAGSLLLVMAALTALLINHRDQVRSLLDGAEGSAPRSQRGPYSQYLLSLARNPLNGLHVLLGTSDGLYASHDGGANWQELQLPEPARQVVALAFSAGPSPRLWVGLRGGRIFESLDGGSTFRPLEAPWLQSDPPEIVDIQATPRGAWIVATTRGLYTQQAEEAEVGAQEGWSLVAAPTATVRPAPSRRLLRLAYDMHDGRLWGSWGIWVTDATSIAALLLVGSGLLAIVSGRPRPPHGSSHPVYPPPPSDAPST